jgi:hypothetical protein
MRLTQGVESSLLEDTKGRHAVRMPPYLLRLFLDCAFQLQEIAAQRQQIRQEGPVTGTPPV